MNGLCLSKSTEVLRSELKNLDTPLPSKSHYPIPHHAFVDDVINKLEYFGYKIKNERHGISQDGNRYFGIIELDQDRGGYAPVVGSRNSHDKSFAASVVAGNEVFVCDNLSFYGDIKIARKHTANILRDLSGFIGTAVGKLSKFFRKQDFLIEQMQNHELTDDRARSLVVEGIKQRVFPVTSLPRIIKEWEEPSHEEFAPRTLWSLFNAVTEVGKDWNPETLRRRTQRLNHLCNSEVAISV